MIAPSAVAVADDAGESTLLGQRRWRQLVAFARRVRWRHPATILVASLIAAGLLAVFVHERGWILLAVVCTVLAVGLIWPWLAMRGVRGQVTFLRSRCREGEPVALRVRIVNRWPWAVCGSVITGVETEGEPLGGDDASPPHAAGTLTVPVLPGWQATVVELSLTPRVRGQYPKQPIRLATGFPFGVWTASRVLEVENELLVWPRVIGLPALPDRGGATHWEGSVFQDIPGDAGEILGSRPYRRGDSLRRVHWGKTARMDRLIVCERQSVASCQMQVILDLDPSVHTPPHPQGSREWAIRIAASLVAQGLRQGAAIEPLFSDVVIRHPCRLPELLTQLAFINDEAGEPLAKLLLKSLRTRGGAVPWIITTDLGWNRLKRQAENLLTSGPERPMVLVLDRSAFVQGVWQRQTPASREARAPGSGWILIDDPHRLPEQLAGRSSGSDVRRGRRVE